MAKLVSKKEELLIKYDGNLNEIDADTFFNSIIPFTAVLQDINNIVNPDYKLKITIKAPQRGSFELLMLFDQSLLQTLFFGVTLATIAEIVGIVNGILSIRKFLKGEKPSEVVLGDHNVTIKDNKGNTINVDSRTYNITINNDSVNDSLDRVFSALNKDKAIEEFKVMNKKKKSLLKADRKEFLDMAKSIPLPEDKEKKQMVSETLIVFKVVFEEKYKWEFYLKDHKINASIEDDSFFKRIDKGEEFAKGDRLEVDMEITKVFDDTLKEYIPKSYTIKKVGAHTKPNSNEQINLL